ncbi:MAG: ferritin-like domain-containing protein [Microthrixaceae bacterium]
MTATMPTNSDNRSMIGRDDVDDLDEILAITNTDRDEIIHHVQNHADTVYTWDYNKGARPALNKLYEKAKNAQWNGETDLPWDTDVDPEKVIADNAIANAGVASSPDDMRALGGPFAKLTDDDFLKFGIESNIWTLSQFLHGEQGALVCTAKIVETVPWIDAKYYASTQVMDEARHVEVFAKYLQDKWGGHYPVNAHLKMLLDDIVNDTRWDMTYLGMQIMVEGLALAAFGFMQQMTTEPLLKKLLRYVMSDEARHVAFGVLSLREYYEELSDAEIFERQQFAFEAGVRMRDRFLQQEVWERMGMNVKEAIECTLAVPERDMFQMMLFSKIVPNAKKLGLLDRNNSWLRRRYEELGVIQFEDLVDTGNEYENFSLEQIAADDAKATADA